MSLAGMPREEAAAALFPKTMCGDEQTFIRQIPSM